MSATIRLRAALDAAPADLRIVYEDGFRTLRDEGGILWRAVGPDADAALHLFGLLLATAPHLFDLLDAVESLATGPQGGGYQPYAVEVDGEVRFAVLLDDLRTALTETSESR